MEEETNRSGINRRKGPKKVSVDKRKGEERRAVLKDPDRIIGFMKKIPLFKGFTNEQYIKILNICSQKIFPVDHYICREGEVSDSSFILLKGKLKVTIKGSTLLNYITPPGLVGEIGVFTGVERSASVLAISESTVIKIHKKELYELLKNNAGLSNCLLLNVIQDIANKLQEDNETIEELRNKKRTRIL